eukprot:1592077-Amphidinium_carterae.1
MVPLQEASLRERNGVKDSDEKLQPPHWLRNLESTAASASPHGSLSVHRMARSTLPSWATPV